METLATIILLLAVVALGYLYWKAKDKAGKAQKLADSMQSENLRHELTSVQNHKQWKWLEKELETKLQTINDLKAALAAKDEQYQELQQNLAEEMAKEIPPIELTRPLKYSNNDFFNDTKFSNRKFADSAIVDLVSITLKADDFLKEDHVLIINKLEKIKIFPDSLKSDFNFNPKDWTIKFKFLEKDNHGNMLSFKSWDQFLLEREAFIKAITEYVESVIKQSATATAVQEVLNGKEASNA